ncbi:hypothetical protein [Psychrobacillus lasiicapitis]|uniref:hypothetical protein n=1 Tax=Psychrobacillus lasiicapitis TaxID=1636719 RepID=UPI0014776761|nr:hypothetical protein [Psychrobacillus lasiicapitis]GGA23479.1 hypothetical protein GCM10011384_11380 [Psychrobacillus lasiicapitis]
MTTNSIAERKWWKVGAATFLSIAFLAACGDGENESDVDDTIDEEIEQDIEEENKDGE